MLQFKRRLCVLCICASVGACVCVRERMCMSDRTSEMVRLQATLAICMKSFADSNPCLLKNLVINGRKQERKQLCGSLIPHCLDPYKGPVIPSAGKHRYKRTRVITQRAQHKTKNASKRKRCNDSYLPGYGHRSV